MIISPPFLPLKDTAVYSEEDVRTLMPNAAPGNGFFPVSQAMAWHGGMHFTATSAEEPVRAIADGVVIFKRDAELVRYDAQDHSTGCVVLRHTTEIGAQGDTATEVVFYSIYQHLRKLDKDLPAVGQPIYRKDKLGLAGFIHGTANRIHLEIVAGDADAQKLLGRSTGDLDLTRDGRSDAVYGQIYVLLPAQSACYASDPRAANNPAPSGDSGAEQLVIGIQHAMGQATLTTYQLTGEVQGVPVPEKDAEYNLYTEATQRHNNLRTNLQIGNSATALPDSSPSGWYELLRFGRNLGPDPLPSNAAHWRKVSLPGQAGAVWVDLNAAGTKKFSDADFPHWMGWKLVDDDIEDSNSQCNSAMIDAMLSPPAQPQTAPSLTGSTSPAPEMAQTTPAQKAANRLRSLADTDIQRQLGKTICKFPTEWADAEVRTRWAWVREQGSPYVPYPLQDESDFTEMSDFAQKLCFWEKLPVEDKNRLTQKHWHLNPVEFIVHFRKCGWLSAKEFMQLLPKQVLREKGKDEAIWERVGTDISKSDSIFIKHRKSQNIMMRKYGVNKPYRMAAYFGNSIQETQWWGKLHEGLSSAWYAPWDGRGFLQLTHPYNYMNYWRFRGREIDDSLYQSMADASNSKKSVADKDWPKITEQIKLWRDQVAGDGASFSIENIHSPADSAGFYWIKNNMATYADKKSTITRNTIKTNNSIKTYYSSQSFWNASASVNLPSAVNNYNRNFNGYIARCVPWAQALAVLGEISFPDASGVLTISFPEGYLPRR
ncbi:hypothetical protein [Comamonas sp. GB3 AK4-5]|uniref:hypothetical protein n=1 Tax=Comamonas sp. GB3 AK4-5 TaxID=3231487 RepID=UPI00351EF1E1